MAERRRQQGTGSLYQTKDGQWRASVDLGYGPDGKRRRKVVSSRSRNECIRKLKELQRQVDRGSDVSTRSITVEKWLALWLTDVVEPKKRPRTTDTYRGYIARYIVPVLGRRRLDQVQPQHVRAVRTRITGELGLSTTTARQAHAIIAKAFKDARREGYTCIDVSDRMDPPAVAASSRSALSVDQAVTLLRSTAEDYLGARWATALLIGARQGECLGLEWDRVDFDEGRIDLSWQLQRLPYLHGCQDGPVKEGERAACGRRRAGNCPQRRLIVPDGFEVRDAPGGLYLTRPKSKAGRRRPPMIPELAAILERLPRRGTLVFCREDGSRFDPSEDNAAWHDALTAAGLPSVPLHNARHTTATLLRAGGVDVRTITAIMGHASAAVTEVYLHEDDTLQRRALEGLGRTLAGQ